MNYRIEINGEIVGLTNTYVGALALIAERHGDAKGTIEVHERTHGVDDLIYYTRR